MIFPHLSSAADKIMVEKELLDEKAFLQKRFSGIGLAPTIQIVGLEPTAAEIESAQQAAKASEQTVLFLYDAHMIEPNHRLLDAVQGAAKRLVIVLMRDVYDAEWVKPITLCLTAYGYRVCDLDAVIQKLLIPVPVSTTTP